MLAIRFVIIGATLAAAPVLASAVPAPASTDSAAAAQKTYDDYMNQKVCESITVTGSRLGGRKICATRSEWAARRLEDRQATDKLQTQLCTHDGKTC